MRPGALSPHQDVTAATALVDAGGLAALLCVEARTAHRNLALERDMPEPICRLLSLAVEMPQARARLERMADRKRAAGSRVTEAAPR